MLDTNARTLSGKRALVTGGSRGIGKAIALDFAREGADVAITYLSSEKEAIEVSGAIKALGRRSILCRADVSQKSQVSPMIDLVREHMGRIDILVNNAGLSRGMDIFELSEDVWDLIVDVNMKGTYLVTQPVAQSMVKRQSGVIINMSSIAGMVGETSIGFALHYNAAKQGIVAMTRTMANAFSPHIRVNAIAPGVILTDFHVTAGGSMEKVQKRIQDVPLRRGGTAEEVARVATFLASDDASYITGQTIVVDGGLGMP